MTASYPACPLDPGRPSPRTGFTLIEVMAAILLTSIVISFAVNFFFNLTESTNRAVARTRSVRHSVALLDRIARDLESAYLLTKPSDADPLDHPWHFTADGPVAGDGADRVSFISRNYRRRTSEGPASDFATITLMLREASRGYELVRLEEPGMPYELRTEFPSDDDEDLMVMGEAIKSFSMRFLSEDGGWQDSWNSVQLLDSSALPLAVEMAVTLLEPGEELATEEDFDSFGEFDDAGADSGSFSRRVILPFRPIDLEALAEGGQAGADACVTVAQCVNSIASQQCAAFWSEACDELLASNPPDTCIEEADNVPDGLYRECALSEEEREELEAEEDAENAGADGDGLDPGDEMPGLEAEAR